MLIRMYQIEISRNDKLLKRSNWGGPELLTLSLIRDISRKSTKMDFCLSRCNENSSFPKVPNTFFKMNFFQKLVLKT